MRRLHGKNAISFEKQLEKLMQNELFDMEADIRLLKQTMKMEGYEEEN